MICGTANISDKGERMYFQFLIEDGSTKILIDHVMGKLRAQNPDRNIEYDSKSFAGIGHLSTTGTVRERKGSGLLNNLPRYLKGIDKSLRNMGRQAAIVVVLDNDLRDQKKFQKQLEDEADKLCLSTDHVFCIAVREMEAWLLGDSSAILAAYPLARLQQLKRYQQDGLCETWQMLANVAYPGGMDGLRKKARTSYTEIANAKEAWADKIGSRLDLDQNKSPSFQRMLHELRSRIEAE